MSGVPAMLRLPRLVLAAGLMVCCAAAVQPAADEAAYQERHRTERARIAAERGRAEQRFTQEQAACQHRFGVTDCMNRSRSVRHQALTELQRQQNLLSDEERRRRAGRRLESLDDKAAEHARDRAAVTTEPPRQPRDPPRPASGKLPGEKPVPTPDAAREAQHEQAMQRRQQEHADGNARRAAQAAGAAAEQKRFDDKQRKAAEYKARVLQREAEQPSKGKPLPPLPP